MIEVEPRAVPFAAVVDEDRGTADGLQRSDEFIQRCPCGRLVLVFETG